jgi:hypothetical protein
MPNATAPDDASTQSRLNRPDHTTAKFAGSARGTRLRAAR